MSSRLQAFSHAADCTKQLIGLSTGVIALAVTFSKDVFSWAPGPGWKALLAASWVLFLLSAVVGIVVLQGLTGTLDQAGDAVPEFRRVTACLAVIQSLLFGLGLVSAVAFAIGPLVSA